ncbi:tetratricopeptide repeat protein [Cytophagaceae bacterium DM2B3-1]|uniref:Tetratricopeptide repeat protein n=1 Tax=Xanthocytophaga flava TaxID=3048013 RepID=A0ABT7CTV6_9BACT|nr:tetratricopeptide repeat protein [Xanthocytophaga flavus]MDJ1497206.1 tetratricopeptide repeat protein [Xanthocytophaga flavus]
MLRFRLSLILLSSTLFCLAQNKRKEADLCLKNQLEGVNKQEYASKLFVASDRILSPIGKSNVPNFIVLECSAINACLAYTDNHNVRYLLYTKDFLSKISEDNKVTDWNALGIFVHEMGHHLKNHTMSRQLVVLDTLRKYELDADAFAGFILQKRGASEQQASLYLENELDCSAEIQNKQPWLEKRKKSLLEGYKNARDQGQLGMVVTQSAESLFNKATLDGMFAQYQKALTNYTQAIGINPNFTTAYLHRGATYNELQRSQEAIEDYTQAIQIEPGYVDAYNNRGITQLELQHYEEAVADFTKAININPNYVEAYQNRSHAYNELQHYQQAMADIIKVISINPELAEAYVIRGNIHRDQEHYAEAMDDYTKAISLNPDLVVAYYNTGLTSRSIQDPEKAIENFTKAINLKSDYIEAYYYRATTYNELERYQEALPDYTRVIQSMPDALEAYFHRGSIYFELQQYQEALTDYTKVISLQSDIPEMYFNRGVVLNKLQRYKESLTDFTKAAQIKPDYAEAYYNIGILKKTLKQNGCPELSKACAMGYKQACTICQPGSKK